MEEIIRKTLDSFGDKIQYTDDVVQMLLLRGEKKEGILDRKSYASVIARNWGVDQIRKQQFAVRCAIARQNECAKEELLRERFRLAKEELQIISVQIKQTAREPLREGLRYMWFVCIEKKLDSECEGFFPGSTRDQRYQWLKRARDRVFVNASENLKEHLKINLGGRGAKR